MAQEALVGQRNAGAAVEAGRRLASDAARGRIHFRATARPRRVHRTDAVGAAVGIDAFAAVETEGRGSR